uniref:Uncharacterized protein n=1 Tax=Trypanosoma congolense (strain IL3000) TaxID=1068625 RepID=G0UN44_TRYCI|nr:hypothetical protein, unlikely [Trypanosoma congolense IL3000]
MTGGLSAPLVYSSPFMSVLDPLGEQPIDTARRTREESNSAVRSLHRPCLAPYPVYTPLARAHRHTFRRVHQPNLLKNTEVETIGFPFFKIRSPGCDAGRPSNRAVSW